MPLHRYPKKVPRERAVAGLDLANKILDYDHDAEPADPDGDHDVTVSADEWKAWMKLARTAAELMCVDQVGRAP